MTEEAAPGPRPLMGPRGCPKGWQISASLWLYNWDQSPDLVKSQKTQLSLGVQAGDRAFNSSPSVQVYFTKVGVRFFYKDKYSFMPASVPRRQMSIVSGNWVMNIFGKIIFVLLHYIFKYFEREFMHKIQKPESR